MKQNQVACEEDVNDEKQHQDGYHSPLLLLLLRPRLRALQQSAPELVQRYHCSSQHRPT
jgi:hypothetical protein